MSDFVPLFTSVAGIRHVMRTNEDGTHTFAASQDTTDIIDRNRAMANENDGYTKSREMRRVASIPYILMLKWRQEDGYWAADAGHDPDTAVWLARKLNDPDYAHLRTATGRLGVTDGVMR